MQFPVNLYALTRLQNISFLSRAERQMSRRENPLKIKEEEIRTLRALVNRFLSEGGEYDRLAGFYYSFEIPQIGKEFDLLKICGDYVLNIELKSFSVPEEKIVKQLEENRYFLKALRKKLLSFTYVMQTGELWQLEDECRRVPFSTLIPVINGSGDFYDGDIDNLFKVTDYLISPINTPERFLNREYFLNSNQRDKKRNIRRFCAERQWGYIGITGSPGTGKTILLYDIAVELSALSRALIIHCAELPQGLCWLDEQLKDIDIIPIGRLRENPDISGYRYIFVDECHRIDPEQFAAIIRQTDDNNCFTFFSYDREQVLSSREYDNRISEAIEKLPDVMLNRLTDRIRTSKELSCFIRRVRDKHARDHSIKEFPSVSLAYANNGEEAASLLKLFKEDGYVYISYADALAGEDGRPYLSLDRYGDYTARQAIGQEFDRVVLVMGANFRYDKNGILISRRHPDSDYPDKGLFYQCASRVRQKLAIIVLCNDELYETMLNIVQGRK